MRIYFDTCALQRPFDDQASDRVRRETVAVLDLLRRHENDLFTLLSSQILWEETARNPFRLRRAYAASILSNADAWTATTASIEERGRSYHRQGLGSADALHLASAIAMAADALCTTDDRFLQRASRLNIGSVRVVSPVHLLSILDSHEEK